MVTVPAPDMRDSTRRAAEAATATAPVPENSASGAPAVRLHVPVTAHDADPVNRDSTTAAPEDTHATGAAPAIRDSTTSATDADHDAEAEAESRDSTRSAVELEAATVAVPAKSTFPPPPAAASKNQSPATVCSAPPTPYDARFHSASGRIPPRPDGFGQLPSPVLVATG